MHKDTNYFEYGIKFFFFYVFFCFGIWLRCTIDMLSRTFCDCCKSMPFAVTYNVLIIRCVWVLL